MTAASPRTAGPRVTTVVGTGAAVAVTAVVGGLASRPAQSAWYDALRKPWFQPPGAAFPVVWPLLYSVLAVVSARTIDRLRAAAPPEAGSAPPDRPAPADSAARRFTALLVLNLVLNGSWTWLFFSRRRLGAATVSAAALALSSTDLTRRAAAVDRTGLALVPYPLWCAFATVLSARIWWLNRR